MALASANFTLDGSSAPPEHAVSGGATVTLALTSISGVRTVVWSIEGNSSHTLVNPTITPSGSPVGATATLTMPVGSGQGYIVQCVVNGGVDDEGVIQSQLTKRAIVGVVDASGTVPFCAGETTERSATYGYVERLNAIAGVAGSGGIADGSITFAKMAPIGIGLVGNDTGTATPKLITVGTGLAFAGGALTVSAVALSAIASIATGTFLGNISGISATPSALTAAQVVANLPTFVASGVSHAQGLVPDPGSTSGSTKFLREDATWAVPAGSFTSPANPGDNNKLAYANAGGIAYASAIKTDGTYLALGAPLTSTALLRVQHNTAVLYGDDHTPTNPVPILRWGTVSNDTLYVGTSSGDTGKMLGQRYGIHTGGTFQWEVNGTAVSTLTSVGKTVTGVATTGTVAPVLQITDAAHTLLTASTERNSVLFDLSQTRQWSVGALATQRSLRVLAPTLGFTGASTVTTAATVSISGAPAAGTNATITQALALWIEAGGIGYGSNAALSGLNRYAQNAQAAVARSSTSTDINLMRWGLSATDELALGDDGAASVMVAAATAFNVRLGGGVAWGFSSTQLDAHGGSFANVTALNGVRIASGPLGSALTDADVTLSVAGGTIYELNTPLTTNRVIKLGVTGSPRNQQVISIRKYVTGSFTITVTDSTGTNVLYVFPAGAKGVADFQYLSAGGQFVPVANSDLS